MCRPDFSGGVWSIDFEFHPAGGKEGNLLVPVCLVAHEINTRVTRRYWQDDLLQMPAAPFPCDSAALILAYNAAAEMACFQALGWPMPANILDLYVEFRCHTNGLSLPAGKGLLGALIYFGEPCMDATKKEVMRDLILTGGPWNDVEKAAILDYCEADVMALKALFLRMDGEPCLA